MVEHKAAKIEAKFKELPEFLGGFSYIVFLIDREADLSAPAHYGVGLGDVLVCIERLIDEFKISPAALYQAIVKEGG